VRGQIVYHHASFLLLQLRSREKSLTFDDPQDASIAKEEANPLSSLLPQIQQRDMQR
jgi:hypothetical protein